MAIVAVSAHGCGRNALPALVRVATSGPPQPACRRGGGRAAYLNLHVGPERLDGEEREEAAAQVLVLLAAHHDHVVLPKDLLAKRVPNQLKALRVHVGEDLVLHLRVLDVHNVPAPQPQC
jgi:hypothetical protein